MVAPLLVLFPFLAASSPPVPSALPALLLAALQGEIRRKRHPFQPGPHLRRFSRQQQGPRCGFAGLLNSSRAGACRPFCFLSRGASRRRPAVF